MAKLKIPGLDTYFGGKGASGIVQKIINEVPTIDTLVIPFAGNCALTRTIRRPHAVLLNDVDSDIVSLWRKAKVPGIVVFNADWRSFLDYATGPNAVGGSRKLIYADPPYLFESRKGGARKVYGHEMGEEQDHRRLLEYLRTRPEPVIISHYPHPLYDEMLTGWRKLEFQAMTRKGPATEALYLNFPKPEVLQDDRFAGDNYRQREYVKRKAQRWLSKWEKLPAHEQQVLLRGILQQTPKALARELLASLPGSDTTTSNE